MMAIMAPAAANGSAPNRITEVLDLTSPGCRQLMHKKDSVLEALEFGKKDGVASGDCLNYVATG